MNTKNISKEKLLIIAKSILNNEGLNNLSIRNIAQKANISVGSIYTYYKNKNDILIDIISDSWNIVIEKLGEKNQFTFEDTINNIYNVLEKTNKSSDKLLNHSQIFKPNNINKAISKMNEYQNIIKIIIKNRLINDKQYNKKLNNSQLDNIVNLLFDTLINDISNQTQNYKTLIILINDFIKY